MTMGTLCRVASAIARGEGGVGERGARSVRWPLGLEWGAENHREDWATISETWTVVFGGR
jgi:hypothetical protein